EQLAQRLVRDGLEVPLGFAVDKPPDRIAAGPADEADAETADGVDELGLLRRAGPGVFAPRAATTAAAVGAYPAPGGGRRTLRAFRIARACRGDIDARR